MIPVPRAVGSQQTSLTAITPGLPAGTVAGDLLLMFLETANEAITVAGGWVDTPGSPQGTGALGTRLTILYKIAAGGDATTTSDSGDHQHGQILGIVAGTFNAANPFNTSGSGVRSVAATTATIPGGTTTVPDCLVVAASSHNLDQAGGAFTTASWANAALSSVTERINSSGTAGNGGGVGVATGGKAAAGAYGSTTVTVTSSVGGMISLAIAPAISPPFSRRSQQHLLVR